MKVSGIVLCVAVFFSLVLCLPACAVNVSIYSGYNTSDGGAPYTGLVGSFVSPDIQFAASTGYNWHPYGLGKFGADITGYLDVAANDNYTFSLSSDDGSMLYIDSMLVINHGGAHSPAVKWGNWTLTAGLHAFEVQFF